MALKKIQRACLEWKAEHEIDTLVLLPVFVRPGEVHSGTDKMKVLG